ncbi:NBS-LRR-like resistance protein [Rhynchospora pubera]|uniref:NBS-LRR-like resistance protein n=1 Tax=Rhynchospora pubera TaxID=906938 RepID=A0AAV8GEX2_9POAL|nr:NBS-LRR-like resistance protein [Rhynchospora pubera]
MASLLTPLISFAVNKAGDALIEKFCRTHGMKKNHKKLHRQLLAVQAVIESAEGRSNEPHVREWLKELRAIAYEAIDALDDFEYEALFREALCQNPSTSRIN